MKKNLLLTAFILSLFLINLPTVYANEGFEECENITRKQYDCYARIAREKLDPKLCENIINDTAYGGFKIECYKAIALETRDVSLCEKINPYFLDDSYCIHGIAHKTQNQSLCKRISNKGIKKTCYEQTATPEQQATKETLIDITGVLLILTVAYLTFRFVKYNRNENRFALIGLVVGFILGAGRIFFPLILPIPASNIDYSNIPVDQLILRTAGFLGVKLCNLTECLGDSPLAISTWLILFLLGIFYSIVGGVMGSIIDYVIKKRKEKR